MTLNEFQERKDVERFIFSTATFFIICATILLAVWGSLRLLQKKLAVNREINAIEDKIEKADVAGSDLNRRLKELATISGIEKEARSRFGLKRPGEEVVVFLEDNPTVATRYKFSPASLWEVAKNFMLKFMRL